jgi:hypothetical protein
MKQPGFPDNLIVDRTRSGAGIIGLAAPTLGCDRQDEFSFHARSARHQQCSRHGPSARDARRIYLIPSCQQIRMDYRSRDQVGLKHELVARNETCPREHSSLIDGRCELNNHAG